MKYLYCQECNNYLMTSSGDCSDCVCGWKQPPQPPPLDQVQRISDLEALDGDRDYSEKEHFVAEHMNQLGVVYLNDDATVFGCTLHQIIQLLKDYDCPDFKEAADGEEA